MKLASQLPENYIYHSRLNVGDFLHIGRLGMLKTIFHWLFWLGLIGVGCVGWLGLMLTIASQLLPDSTALQQYPSYSSEQAWYLILGSMIGLIALPELTRFVILLLLNGHPRLCRSLMSILQIVSTSVYFTRPQYWIVSLIPYVIEICLAIGLLLVQPLFFAPPVILAGGFAVSIAFSNRIPRLLWMLTHPPGYLYSENQSDKVDAYSPRVQASNCWC